MKVVLKVLFYFCFITVAGGAGFLGYICHRQQCKLEEMEVAVSSQREKILKLESGFGKLGIEGLNGEIKSIKDRLSSDRERLDEAEKMLDGIEDMRGSVKNLSEGMFGTYPCSDLRYSLAALSFKNLPRDVKHIREQMDDVTPKDYDDLKKTVEALSTCVYGEYPHSELTSFTSLLIDGSMKEQLKKIKSKLDALEISVRYSIR